MKILAFSDLHQDRAAAKMIVDAGKYAEVIVGAGDFATCGKGAVETLEILKNCTSPVVLVHGNHDNPREIALFCENWENGHYLHGNSVMIGSQIFFGLGGEIPSRNPNPWNISETEVKAAEMLILCPEDAVLITHTPPLGIVDIQKNGEHKGSTAILTAASSCKPKLLLCGHIHNAWGMQGIASTTPVHNLGPTINWFDT